jgi:DNA processing protein
VKPDVLRKITALTLMPGMGAMSFKKLYEAAGSLDGIFTLEPRVLTGIPRLAKTVPPALTDKKYLKLADVEIEKARKGGARLLTVLDDDYPALLKAIPDPPAILYVKGALPSDDTLTAGIVGSRIASLYGTKMAGTIARDLAAAGVAVISGLAKGIDGAAHEGALEARGITVGVLGGGLNKLYPPENAELAERMAENGAVISEFPMDWPSLPENFPLRNRIISGLSRGVLVVEAKEKSGALITVDAALEQGREVWAVPGNADSLRSAGTNKILKQGAKLVTSAADILDELGAAKAQVSRQKAELGATADEKQILAAVESEAVHIDTVLERSGMPAQKGISTLQMLVLKGVLKEMPGKHYRRS